MKIIVGIVLGALIVLCAGAAAVATGVVPLTVPPPQTQVQASPPLQPLSQSPIDADLTITLSERYLNKQISKGLPQGGSISDVVVDVRAGGNALVTATTRVNNFLTLRPQVTIQAGQQNGRIVITVLQVNAGGFNVPSSMIEPQIAQLKTDAENALNRALVDPQNAAGMTLREVSTTDNSFTVVFTQ